MILKHSCLLFIAVISLISFTAHLGAQEHYKFEANLDPFITLPGAWKLTPDAVEKMFPTAKGMKKNPHFKWLTSDHSRAHFTRRPYSNVTVDLTFFDGSVGVEEAIIDFKDGKLLGLTVSILNRGDSTKEDIRDFDRRLKISGKKIGEILAIRPTRRESRPAQGFLTEGWIWLSGKGLAVLEYNPEAPESVEFLRMRFARRDAGGAYEAATRSRAGASVKLSELPANVKKDDKGNVYVSGLPMVDQGRKGYCVVASAQRLFEYYGIPCDQHQLAQIAGSDPERGTSVISINEELGKIDHCFKTRFEALAVKYRDGSFYEMKKDNRPGRKVSRRDFHKRIHTYIDKGIPLLWALELGRFQEEPSISLQTGGNHMRMIIGYNDKTNRIIFSDSWGAGHEFKTMDADDVYMATHGLFVLQPVTR